MDLDLSTMIREGLTSPSVHQPIRVMHVINNLAVGGAESALCRVATDLREEFDQSVICLLDRGALAPQLELAGVPVTALGASPRLPSPALVSKLAKLIRRQRPDIVQTWLYQSDLVGALAASLARHRKVVWNLRGTDLLPKGSPILTRLILPFCAALSTQVPVRIVCCARSVREFHVRKGYDESRMAVIPNGVDLERFRPSREARVTIRGELGLQGDAVIIGHVARLHPLKDHDTFFGAVRLIQRLRTDLNFVLVGQRTCRSDPELVKLLRRHEISAQVHLLGERRDVPRITAAFDIATSSSWSEGFPNAVCEAMACEVPCVATEVGDARDIIGETGMLVPRRDPAALCAAWMEMLSQGASHRARLGAAARERVVALYDQRRSSAAYAQLYRDIAAVPN